MLVGADGDADVEAAEPDGGHGMVDGARRGRARVEHVGERDAGEPEQTGDRVELGGLPAATDRELHIAPRDAGIGEGVLDGVGRHLERRLLPEAAEGVQPDADDRNVVHVSSRQA